MISILIILILTFIDLSQSHQHFDITKAKNIVEKMPRDFHKTSLNGKHFTIAAENWNPCFMIYERDGKTEYGGFMWDLLSYMVDSMNFTFTIVRPPDGKWGVGDANGNWNGMLGMIKRNEVDFAIGPFGVIYEREKEACDFTFPIVIGSWKVVVPLDLSQDPWPFIRPFSWHVWICCFISVPFFWLATGFLNRIFHQPTQKVDWSRIANFIIRVSLQESPTWYPNECNFNRIMTATWLIVIFVLSSSYSSTLISNLTIPELDTSIKSVNDLVNQNEIGWLVEKGSVLHQIGKLSPVDSIFGKVHSGATYSGICSDDVERMKTERKAGICDSLSVKKMLSDDFTKHGTCNFYVGEKDFITTSFAMAFQTKSPYLEDVNKEILKFLQFGLEDKVMSYIMPNATECQGHSKLVRNSRHDEVKLTMYQTEGIFMLVIIGLLTSVAAFFIERAYHHSFKI